MFGELAIVCILLWILGLSTSVLGGLIHVLLVLGLLLLLAQGIQGYGRKNIP